MRPDTLAFLAHHRATRSAALGDDLARVIEEQTPTYGAPAVVTRAELRASCRSNVERVLELLGTDLGDERGDAADARFDAAAETGRHRAEQGVPIDDLLRSFRLGGRLIWDDLISLAQTEPQLTFDGESLREVGTSLWQVVDRTSARAAAAYHQAEHELVRTEAQRRAAIWEELLAGRATDPGFATAACHALGLPRSGPYVAVALTSAAADVEARLQQQEVDSSWHRRTDVVVGILAVDGGRLPRVLELLASTGGARGGVSGVVDDLTQLTAAFGEARLALRTLAPGEAGVVRFEYRLVDALLLSDTDLAARLVEVWLGPLLALPAGEGGVLLDTLRAWVRAGGAITQTATLANCHRNTAMNRLARIGEILGQTLSDVVPLEIGLALRAHQLDLSH